MYFCSKIQLKTQFIISYMVIDSVEIGGFANIHDVKVVLNDVTALIAPNGEHDARAKPQGVKCPKCGAHANPEDGFCMECGAKL